MFIRSGSAGAVLGIFTARGKVLTVSGDVSRPANGRCSFRASSRGAVIQVSTSSGAVEHGAKHRNYCDAAA
jgi:hypothetical protein